MTKTCLRCNKEFDASSVHQLYCAKCRELNYRETVKKKHESYLAYTAPVKKKKKAFVSLVEMNKLAREAGMSYGYYVGLNGLA